MTGVLVHNRDAFVDVKATLSNMKRIARIERTGSVGRNCLPKELIGSYRNSFQLDCAEQKQLNMV